jgi:hypothetical protein
VVTKDTKDVGEIGGPPAGGAGRTPRRGLLAGAAAVAGVIAAETLASTTPAQATQGSAVLLGQDNTGAMARTGLFDTGSESAVLADPVTHIGVAGTGGANGSGVRGIDAGSGSGVFGSGGTSAGAGVTGFGAGGGPGVSGTGLVTVAAGSSKVTKTGVALTAASLVLATLQQDVPGVWVRSAVPNSAGSSFTVHLSKAVPASTKIAWFVVN